MTIEADKVKAYAKKLQQQTNKRKYAEDKQVEYETRIIAKLLKGKIGYRASDYQTLAQLNDAGVTFKLHSYRSKTNYGLSALIKSLERTAIWTEYNKLMDWYPDNPTAMVFKCPSNGYRDLVLASQPLVWSDWHVMIQTENDGQVYITDFKYLIDSIGLV